jgi:hypothetical protein
MIPYALLGNGYGIYHRRIRSVRACSAERSYDGVARGGLGFSPQFGYSFLVVFNGALFPDIQDRRYYP